MVNSIVFSALSLASNFKNALMTRIREEVGQDLIEYAMLVGFIAVAAAIAFIAIDLPGAMGTFASKVQQCVSLDTFGCGA